MNPLACFLLPLAVCLSPIEARAVEIATVKVGDPGNAPDTRYNSTGFGAVAYKYRIGTYEVTNAEYADFLNAKAKSDPLGLYTPAMGQQTSWGGITRNGIDGNYNYSVLPNMGNKPVNLVSWFDAVRFANWLNNGQGDGDTETGAYNLLGVTGVPSDSDRNIT